MRDLKFQSNDVIAVKGNGLITLTTQTLKISWYSGQHLINKVIDLKDLESVDVYYEARKWNIILALLIIMSGYLMFLFVNDVFLYVSLVAAIPLLLLYFFNGRHYMSIEARNDYLFVDTNSMRIGELMDLMDEINDQKEKYHSRGSKLSGMTA